MEQEHFLCVFLRTCRTSLILEIRRDVHLGGHSTRILSMICVVQALSLPAKLT